MCLQVTRKYVDKVSSFGLENDFLKVGIKPRVSTRTIIIIAKNASLAFLQSIRAKNASTRQIQSEIVIFLSPKKKASKNIPKQVTAVTPVTQAPAPAPSDIRIKKLNTVSMDQINQVKRCGLVFFNRMSLIYGKFAIISNIAAIKANIIL